MSANSSSKVTTKVQPSQELFFESSPDCVKILDMAGHLLSMNKNGQCVMEIDDFESVCGALWPELWPEESHELIHIAFETAKSGGTGHFVAFCPTAKGTPKWWDVRVTSIRQPNGELEGFLSVSRDVTTLRRANEALSREERFSQAQKTALELAVSNAPLADVLDRLVHAAESYTEDAMLASVLLLASDGKTLHVGAALSLPVSYSQAIDGASIGPNAGSCGTAAYRRQSVFVRDIQNDPLWADYKELAALHNLASCWSVPILSADGLVFGTFAFYYREVRDPTSLEIQAMQLLVHTATLVLEKHNEAQQKKVAEKALKESEAKFRSITNAMPQVVWSTRPDGYHDYYNDRWYEFTGVPWGTTDGEGWSDLFHPEDQPRAWELWRRSLESGEPYEIEYRLRHHTGQYRWTLGRAVPVRDESGKITRWMGTCTDIHEQRITHETLKQSDRRKDEFLAMLAHELRNPLAPISAAAHLLSMGNLSEERLQRLSEVITRQSEHMKDLIDDLLDVSRVTRGLITLEMEAVDIKRVVFEAIEQVRALIDARSHHLETHMSSDSAVVHGDKNRLVQIVANLLTNAAKYTPNEGRIMLRINVDDSFVTISVHDNGIGMEKDLLTNVFEMFAQGARTPDRSQGGLGIGLALVKSLVQIHGGIVEARSDGEGQGSEFTLRFPRLHLGKEYSRPHQEGEGAKQGNGALRVLVVDDNVDAAQLLAMFVEDAGHEVFVEYSALKAIECAQKVIPDVCLLDIGLPDIDGNELARRLRAVPELKDVVLVAVTGYGQRADIETCLAAGFDHHFVKPADTKRLEALLVQIVPKKNMGYHDFAHTHSNNYLH